MNWLRLYFEMKLVLLSYAKIKCSLPSVKLILLSKENIFFFFWVFLVIRVMTSKCKSWLPHSCWSWFKNVRWDALMLTSVTEYKCYVNVEKKGCFLCKTLISNKQKKISCNKYNRSDTSIIAHLKIQYLVVGIK